MKIFTRVILFFIAVTFSVLSFQNCQKPNREVYGVVNDNSEDCPDNGSCIESTPTPTPPTGAINVITSARSDYASPKTSFNYDETLYQKVENLGAGAKGCVAIIGQSDNFCNNPPTNFVNLGPSHGWNYNTSTQVWTTTYPAKNVHGMTTVQYFIKSDGSGLKTNTLTFQSVSQFNTNDVVYFNSSDIEGLHVKNEIPTNTTFYSHVKNGNTSMKFCQHVKTSSTGTSQPTNPCTAANLNNSSIWVTLPAETASDGNSSMLTYVNPANTLHKTEIDNYINTTGTTIVGPVWLKLK